jgi:hypothetical protein
MGRFFKLEVAVLFAVIGALASPGVRAQSAPVSTDPTFKTDYVFSPSSSCQNAEAPACGRKPGSQSLSDFDTGVATPNAEGDRLRVQGDPMSVRVDARKTTIADILFGLASAFSVRYRSSIALDEVRNGTYSGSLRHVISRVLDGYNYVIQYKDSKLDIIVTGKVGEQPIAAPQTAVRR